MKRYVLGFCFDYCFNHLMLVLKAKPEWQSGRLNGLGGKIEEGESPTQAMLREAGQECPGLEATWTPYGRLRGGDWEVWLFHGKTNVNFGERPWSLRQSDDVVGSDGIEGCLQIVPRLDFYKWPALPNLRYLVPMAFNHARHLDRAEFLEISETVCPITQGSKPEEDGRLCVYDGDPSCNHG
jgi:8-oxo-dGTP diphosphatase